MVRKIFLIVLSLSLLSSCSPKVKPIEIITKPVEIVIVAPPPPEPVVLNDITWKVLNINDIIYYGISVADYGLLAGNMLELKRYIIAQKNIIVYYKEATAPLQ